MRNDNKIGKLPIYYKTLFENYLLAGPKEGLLVH